MGTIGNALTWLVRYGHVLSAAVWVGTYALLSFLIVPLLGSARDERLGRLAIAAVRVGTYAGTSTMAFGFVLISRTTEGYGSLFGTVWGALVLASIATAVALLGLGDAGLRPAIRRLAKGDDDRGAARRWALAGFALTVLAVGLMTGAVYANT